MRIPTDEIEETQDAGSLSDSELAAADTRGGDDDLDGESDVQLLPTRIGRFVVIKEVGTGAMGVVYAAYDDMLDRKVAVKLLHRRHAASAEARARLLREAKTIAKLSHPNVIAVYDVGTHGKQVFVAMEFVDGITLRQWQHDPGRSWRELLEKYIDAGRGLAAAHRAGIVHRDFKPDNVLVGKDGRVRVLDFGLARPATAAEAHGAGIDPDEHGDLPMDATGRPLTRTGAILGTPAYMAPEQYEGAAADEQTDQFGFCVSLYEGLYGTRPFPGDTLGSLATHVLDGYIADPPTFTKVPQWLRRVVLRGLRPRADARYRDMPALLADLGRDRRVRLRATVAASVAVVGLLAIGATLWDVRQQGEAQVEGDRLRSEFERAMMMSVEDQLRASRARTVAEKWDELVLAFARTALDADPTRSLAALKHLSPASEWWLPAARTIAVEARRRGVVRRRLAPTVGEVHCLEFSPDASQLAACGNDGRVALWTLGTPEPRFLTGHRGAVHDVAFAPDGASVVSGGSDGIVRVWPLGEGRGRTFRGHAGAVLGVAFGPEGDAVASAGSDGSVRLWQLGQRETRAFVNHAGPAVAVAFAPDGQALASGSDDGTVRLWLLGDQRSRVFRDHDSGARGVWFSPDGTWLTSLDGSGSVREWSVETGRAQPVELLDGAELMARSAHGATALLVRDGTVALHHESAQDLGALLGLDGTVTALALGFDGRIGATATSDGSIQVWGTALERASARWRLDVGLEKVALPARGDTLIAGGSDGSVQMWTLANGERKTLRYHDARIRALAPSPDGRTLATVDERGVLATWSIESPDAPPRAIRTESEASAKALAWSADGEWIAVSGCGIEPPCRVWLHRPTDGTTRDLGSSPTWISALVFGPRGRRLISDHPSEAGAPTMWDLTDGSSVRLTPIENEVTRRLAVAFVEDGAVARVATASDGAEGSEVLRVWHWGADAHVIFERRGLQSVRAAGAAPTLLVQTEDGRALLWDLTDDRFRVLPRLTGAVRSFDISPDGRTILTGLWGGGESDQRFDHLVDVASGEARRLATLFSPLAWASDGRMIADVYRRREVRVWRDPTPQSATAFLAWLDDETAHTIERSALR